MEKILVISTMYPSERHPSFGVFVKNQVEALKASGLSVDVLAVTNPSMTKPAVVTKYTMWLVRVLFCLLTKGRRYDVVHAHYVYPSGRLARFFQKWFKTRMIVTAHGGDLEKMAHKGSFFFKRTRQSLRQADHIIAVGEKLRDDIVKTYGVADERVTVQNMGVDRQIFQPAGQKAARRALVLAERAIIILFVGNIIPAKGVGELVTAYQRLKVCNASLELHLVGAQKEPAFAHWLQEKIAHDAIPDVYIHPPVEQSVIARWLNAADVFVLPSHKEGFGLVALEAMACHTPVVASDVGGLSDLLSCRAGLLIEPHNTVSLQNGIHHVLQNPSLRQELVANGAEKARENDQARLLDELLVRYQNR